MFEIVFLGTAASVPGRARGLPALMVIHGPRRFLVDCGEGTQRQILKAGLGYRRINRVLITHRHLDHVLGLGGIVATFSEWAPVDRLQVLAPPEALALIATLVHDVVLRGEAPRIEIGLTPLRAGTVIEEAGITVAALPVMHRGIESFGFRFEEPPRRRFLDQEAARLGVPPGPLRRRLVAGEAVRLPDGRRIAPDAVRGAPEPGSSVAIIGDTERVDNLRRFVAGADALVIEGTFLERDRQRARAYGHITAAQAATLAAEAAVGHLYLTHLSGRYREAELLAEARSRFARVSVARDFMRVTVRRPRAAAAPVSAPHDIRYSDR